MSELIQNTKADIGVVGLAVMGQNLVLNMNDKGFKVAVYNRTTSKVDDLIAGRAKGKNVVGTHSLDEFVNDVLNPAQLTGHGLDNVRDSLQRL